MALVFVSPEALEKGPWLKIMKKKRDSVSLLVFDELHCLSEWYVTYIDIPNPKTPHFAFYTRTSFHTI